MKARAMVTVLAVPAVLTLCLVAWTYVASERHFHSFPAPPAFTTPIPKDATAIKHGEHLAHTRGCFGCHGPELAGELGWEGAVAPNLPALARNESASTLEAAIRHGIGHDGNALYSMPSYNFLRMRDDDVADIIGYLRSSSVVRKELPEATLPWTVRWDIARGNDGAIAAYLHLVPELIGGGAQDTVLSRGEYIAMTTCNECHGFSLRADTPWGDSDAPDLIIVSAYREQHFRTLMKTGIALGGRELEVMSEVARGRFAYFTDEEIADLYAFLSDMASRAKAAPTPAF